MKIAYCFSGHLRTGRNNPSLVQYLLGPNPGDVFIHTFRTRGNPGPQWHKDWQDSEELTADDLNWIEDTYKPLALEVSPHSCGAEHLPPEVNKMGFRVSQARVQEMRAAYGDYDVVFHARFDLMLHAPFVFPKVKPNTLYGGSNGGQHKLGLDGEVFLFGTPEVMTAMSIPAVPPEFHSQVAGWECHGERLVTAIRKGLGFDYVPVPLRYGLLRSDGRVLNVRNI